MSTISFGGLVSGLDSNKIIQQLLAIESRPISILSKQKSTLQSKFDAFKDLNTKLAALEDKAFALTQFSNIVSRKATPSNASVLSVTSNSNASIGTFQVEVLQLASATKRQTANTAGQGNSNGGVADLTDFSAETVTQLNTNNRLKGQLSEGTFFVNGQQILVTNTKSINDIITDINTATGGTVTGSLVMDPAKNGLVLQLNSGSAITISNGTSNFLSLTNLDTATYAAGSLTSTDAINGVRNDLKLDGSAGAVNLSQAVGSGTLTINGVGVSYNAANDSINDIISRINTSNTGVTASFSSAGSGKLILTSQQNGPLSINVSDSGNFANALGINSAASETLGNSAQIKVDGGPTQFFNSNAGLSPAGLTGITLDLKDDDPGNPVTVTVNADSDTLVNKAKEFVSQYNSVVNQIAELTKYDAATQKGGILIADSSISGIKERLNRLMFTTVSGLSEGTTTGSLTELGFNTGAVGSEPGTTTQLQLDESKLRAAVQATPTRVAQLLGATATTDNSNGAFQRVKNYLDSFSNSTGILAQKQKSTNTQIQSIDKRINTLNKQLEFRQKLLENQFGSLETTLAGLQSQQSALSGLLSSLNR